MQKTSEDWVTWRQPAHDLPLQKQRCADANPEFSHMNSYVSAFQGSTSHESDITTPERDAPGSRVSATVLDYVYSPVTHDFILCHKTALFLTVAQGIGGFMMCSQA